jgi:hypothetical protein
MRDLVADWKKWNSAERVLAVMVILLMVAWPLGLLMTRLARPGCLPSGGNGRLRTLTCRYCVVRRMRRFAHTRP